jgi:hypothetical protein
MLGGSISDGEGACGGGSPTGGESTSGISGVCVVLEINVGGEKQLSSCGICLFLANTEAQLLEWDASL